MKKFLTKIIFAILYRNHNIFYEGFYNSLNFVHLIFWNLVRPGRTIVRIKYNRFLFPKKIKKIDTDFYVDTKNLSKNEIVEISAKKLIKYGAVILNQYFDDSILSKFENEYKDDFSKLSYEPSDFYSRTDTLPFSKVLTDLWFDEVLIDIMKKYIKRLPLARQCPYVDTYTPKSNYSTGYKASGKNNFADEWHVDHATLIQPAIYLTDVTEQTTRMQVILGSNTYPNVSNPGFISNEYVSKNNLTTGNCIGKRGTVQFHCGNTFHRFQPVKNSTRTWIKFQFSSGNNIYTNAQHIGKMLKNNFDLSSLDNRSRKIISGIFLPEAAGGKGYDYDLKKGSLKPTKFKGI